MSRFLRSTAMKVAIVLGLVVLTTGGVLLGIEGTSGAGPAAAPAVDHQLCYSASATGFKIPPAGSVRFIDQFAPNGIVPIRIGPLAINCNPVVKTVITAAGGKKVTPVTNPNAHLACFPIGVADAADQDRADHQPVRYGLPPCRSTDDPVPTVVEEPDRASE